MNQFEELQKLMSQFAGSLVKIDGIVHTVQKTFVILVGVTVMPVPEEMDEDWEIFYLTDSPKQLSLHHIIVHFDSEWETALWLGLPLPDDSEGTDTADHGVITGDHVHVLRLVDNDGNISRIWGYPVYRWSDAEEDDPCESGYRRPTSETDLVDRVEHLLRTL